MKEPAFRFPYHNRFSLIHSLKNQSTRTFRKGVFHLMVFSWILCISCSTAPNEPPNRTNPREIVELKKTEVSVMIASKQAFDKELVSNGKLVAQQKVDLHFMLNEHISKIYHYNGDLVKKGELLAELDDYELRLNYSQSKSQFEIARLGLADFLIGQGYQLSDSSTIPDRILKNAKLRSGYDQAESTFLLAKYNLRASKLYAPISGIVANMFSIEKNYPSGEGPFCTIINHRQFLVDFPIMESEIQLVKQGLKVEVTPYYNDGIITEGYIKYINPVVSESGLIRVTAALENTKGMLYEGMNVKLSVKNTIPDQIALPKKAITSRSNREVVFSYKKGKAHWNYIKTDIENTSETTVTEGIAEGDTIILDGNLHLAHLSDVLIKRP